MQVRLRSSMHRQGYLGSLLAVLLLASCSDEPLQTDPAEVAVETPASAFEILNPQLSESAKEIALDYVAQISTDFDLVAGNLEILRTASRALLNQPDNEALADTRQAWLDAHTAFELTALHRYFASEMFEEQDSLALLQLQYQINHWPIVPGYLDYVEGYPDSGIVHDINVDLDSASLREQHGSFDVSEVTLGFHVIEFLLWGYGVDSALRPATDYNAIEVLSPTQAERGYALEQLDNNRRRALLSIVTDILLTDFDSLQSLWNERVAALSERIEATSGTEIIVALADSMSAMLTEELLLRSLYPMLNGDFVESIQSPYSRSTQNAVSSQLSGLERLLLERQTTTGTTLDLVFSAISDEFSEFFYQNFDASKSCLVLLYSERDSTTTEGSNEREIEIVECINLLTNMIDYNNRLKFDLTN
jgi:putative iron-regulated protein